MSGKYKPSIGDSVAAVLLIMAGSSIVVFVGVGTILLMSDLVRFITRLF